MRKFIGMAWPAVAVITAGLLLFFFTDRYRQAPEDVGKSYLLFQYANRGNDLYSLVSDWDQRHRSRSDHLETNPAFPADVQQVADRLASMIQFEVATSRINGDRAFVTISMQLPNAGDQEISNLMWGDPKALEPAAVRDRLRSLEALQRQGRVPTVAATRELELLREDSQWRVFLNWADTFQLSFHAAVQEGLPWTLEVAPARVSVKPGETVQVIYTVTNASDQTITAKALHRFDPPVAEAYSDLVQCFCFFEDTLAPGESREQTLVLRLQWEAPDDLSRAIDVTYEYQRVPPS